MSRLTDNDKKFWIFTFAKVDWNPLRVVFSSGGDEEHPVNNNLTTYMFGYVLRISLPNLVPDWLQHHAGVFPDGSTYDYHERHSREYGFSLHEGFLNIFYGPQTMDSTTEKSWGYFIPWTQWRFFRFSLYDLEGNHFWTQLEKDRGNYIGQYEKTAECPSVSFEFKDFDDELITAKTHIEEREWRFGEGYFKWLSLFRKPKVERTLSLDFDKEVGLEKGSWKGGTVGHSIAMLPNELHVAAFVRYCEKEHRSKHGKFKITYVRKI